jgi:hypothetical protein
MRGVLNPFFNSAGNTAVHESFCCFAGCFEEQGARKATAAADARESFMSSSIGERNLNEPLVPLLFDELHQCNSLFIQAVHTYDDSYRRNGVLLRKVSLCPCRHERATHVSLFAELCASFERYNEETRTSLGE